MQDFLRNPHPGRLLRRSFVLTCLALLLFCSQSKGQNIILDYAQAVNSTADDKTITVAANGSISIVGTDIPVVITILGGVTGSIPAVENITANSDGPASYNPTTGAISQPISGTVSFTAPGFDYLTANFSNVTMVDTNNLTGTNKLAVAGLTAAQPPQLLALSSTVLPASMLNPPVAMSLSLTLTKAFTWDAKTGSITPGTYKAGETGIFQQLVAIPEPSSFLIAGIGGLGLIGYGLRRRKAMGA
jgi:hypothetical protein